MGAPWNLWESLEWLRLRFLPQVPCEEGLEADASGFWQPSSVEGKGSFQLLPKAKEKHCWAGSSPALACSLHGCCVKGKPFPQAGVPIPLDLSSLTLQLCFTLAINPHLFPAFLANPDPSPQAVLLTCPFLPTGYKKSTQPIQKPSIWILQ